MNNTGCAFDRRVRLTVLDGQIIITLIADEPMTLEQRLTQFDPARHGGEAMCVQSVGAEKW
ncbi:MAG: hypothetical protein K2Q13_06300 [Nitrosomonas sp.]|uniref:AbrB/MazE/SpoVT family DNA-binding domain-containing protein n=1 Tax=Nitrosomonas sp. TaxID=42353 RepID=UPI0025F5FC8A|nr:hypothetical protein [Nitrosomonas sp.]MBY0474657.1 hypothetical protein [Nitrosomonas sp.]